MDRLPAIGSSLPSLPPSPARVPASREAAMTPFAVLLTPEPSPAAALGSAGHGDPATDQESMRHFMGHVNAECFVSLLKVVDPMPDDYLARATYKLRYRHLRESLEIPVLAPESEPAGTPKDPRAQS
jgi:hypothetical protein